MAGTQTRIESDPNSPPDLRAYAGEWVVLHDGASCGARSGAQSYRRQGPFARDSATTRALCRRSRSRSGETRALGCPTFPCRIALDYLRDPETGDPFPGLWVAVSPPEGGGELELQCHLDSGAELSLFDGEIAQGIGLELQAGAAQNYSTSSGTTLTARVHRVRLSHEELGEHELRVGFSEQRLARNLLGRDFFNLFRIGFRERESILLFEPEE